MIRNVLGLIDYIAVDIKSPFDMYYVITQRNININKIRETINIVKNASVKHEFRTTVVPLLKKKDIVMIAKYLDEALLVLQQFRPGTVLDDTVNSLKPYTKEEIESIAQECRNYTPVQLRGF